MIKYFHLVNSFDDGLIQSAKFDTWEAARDDAKREYENTTGDIRGDLIPQLTNEVVAATEAKGASYESGLFWMRTNRYAAIFSTAKAGA